MGGREGVTTEPIETRSGKRGILFLSFGIVILGLFVYWNSLKGPFIVDDHDTIVHNFALRDLSRLPQLVSQNFYYWAGVERSTYFRPLTQFMFALEYHLWGLNPVGYRLTNLSLHLVNAMLVFFLAQRWLSWGPAASVSLLFLVHPVNVHAVANISARSDPLFFFFSVLTIYLWTAEQTALRPLCWLSFLLALFSKEPAVIAPALILLVDLLRGLSLADAKTTLIGRWPWYLGFGLVFLLYLTIRVGLLDYPLFQEIERSGFILTLGERLPLAAKLLGEYLILMFFPMNLAFSHTTTLPKDLFAGEVMGPVLSVILMGYIGIKLWHREKAVLLGLAWFLIGILPFLQLITLFNVPMDESRLYLPEVGFFIFLVALGKTALQARFLCVTVALLVLLPLAIRASVRSADWGDPRRLFEKNVELYPHSYPARLDLGQAYLSQGRTQDAIETLERAALIAPKIRWRPHLLLARAYFAGGQDEQAETELLTVLRLRPNHAWARQQLGILYFSSGRWQEAKEQFAQALLGIPPIPTLHHYTGSAYLALGEDKAAEGAFAKALRQPALSPDDHAQVHIDLGLLLKKRGRLLDARREFELALRFHPGNQKALKELESLQ